MLQKKKKNSNAKWNWKLESTYKINILCDKRLRLKNISTELENNKNSKNFYSQINEQNEISKT